MQKSKSGLSSSLSSSLSLSSSPSLSSSIADSLTPSNIDSAQTVSKVRMANSHGSAAQEGYEATIDPSVPQHYVHARAPVVHGTLQNALPGAAAAANAGLGETGGNIFYPRVTPSFAPAPNQARPKAAKRSGRKPSPDGPHLQIVAGEGRSRSVRILSGSYSATLGDCGELSGGGDTDKAVSIDENTLSHHFSHVVVFLRPIFLDGGTEKRRWLDQASKLLRGAAEPLFSYRMRSSSTKSNDRRRLVVVLVRNPSLGVAVVAESNAGMLVALRNHHADAFGNNDEVTLSAYSPGIDVEEQTYKTSFGQDGHHNTRVWKLRVGKFVSQLSSSFGEDIVLLCMSEYSWVTTSYTRYDTGDSKQMYVCAQVKG